jgi:nicotinate-nucleotide pyrophosphorylase (carboxylating)
VAKQALVLCGVEVAARVFHRAEAALRVRTLAADGDALRPGQPVLDVRGPTAGMLMAERTALNFLQHLSGIATLSRAFAEAVRGTNATVVDTRKTTPGWRALEKHAVRCGGCANHRSTLGELVLIKDNHLAAAGSLARAVRLARAGAPHLSKIEVEVTSLAEVRQALRAGAEIILLDNMSPAGVRQAVELIDGRARVEASGGIHLGNVRDYALAGADVISVGALTHSAPAVDLSLELAGGRR